MHSRYKFNLWRRFLAVFVVSFILAGSALAALVIVVDPYGIRVGAGDEPRPIVDINQRFMYPQLARSHLYNAAVFGTSSLRLIDPEELDRLFAPSSGEPIHFANLAMNAATPWEQMQLARLFLRAQPAPQVLIVGIDRPWCDRLADTPEKRLTFRTFPERFYDDNHWNDWLDTLNMKSLEISIRLMSHRLGLRDVSLRDDGYGIFVPPDNLYDPTRARTHIWAENAAKGLPAEVTPQNPPVIPTAQEQAAWQFPAADWLDALLQQVPAQTQVYILFPPAHISAQPRPGSLLAAEDSACKQHFTAIGARHNATVLDFRKASSITREDANFWDPLHYRLPFASRIAQSLVRPDTADDFYDIIRRRAPNHPSSAQ
ncbi:hypothetical protein [Pseudochelatococcus sp. G4_1912]|uniref:hypothetical protein n=1 Tax=Pseudochelatococcus sp. G4_1912 TaxID=3114288 RepID=UPI0039C74BD5